jgi:DNA-binding NarL/FixJ family response regulator
VEGLREIIGGAPGFICSGAFGSVEEAVPVLRESGPDVLLLDIQLPGMAGDEAVKLLGKVCPATEILMLTVFSDRLRVFTAICNGADGYLLKSTPPDRLLESIRTARSGGSPISPEIARQIVDLFQRTGGQTSPTEPLRTQEIQLLSLLADGYSYSSAAAHMRVSVNTVRNYVRSVYDKLHVHSKSEAVGRALRDGLIR